MPIDWKVFHHNRASVPASELAPYAGQWVAWSFDGSKIVASSAESWEDVYRILKDRGETPNEYLVTYVEHPEDEFDGAVIVSRVLDRRRGVAVPLASPREASNPDR